MKTYVEKIVLILNEDYIESFKNLSEAIKTFDDLKKIRFKKNENVTIYESGDRSISDDENTLELYFINKTVSDKDFEMLHPASIANLEL